MRRIIKDGSVVEDSWTYAGAGAGPAGDAPEGGWPEGNIIVPLATWLVAREALLRRGGGLGVRLAADDDPGLLAGDLGRFDVIALEFPNFADGRAFSAARLLRERYGYTGELRAVGDVLRDQLYFMRRCGIDSFELRPDKDPEDALAAFSEISVRYQPAADEPPPVR